jgi:peptide/nickel transport system substrate-binding protein
MPYDKIFETIYGRGIKMNGAKSKEITTPEWPQPIPFTTNIEKAKELLKEANYPNGFKTDLYIDMGSQAIEEPIAKAIQEGLKKINVDVVIHRVATNQWRKEFIKKEMPMLINSFGSWLNYPDYFFFWNYHGQNAVFNTMSYQNPEMDKFIEGALQASSPDDYQKNVKAMIAKAYDDVPRIPLFQMYQDVVLQPDVHGYVYWFFRQLVFSTFYKGNPEDKTEAEGK